MDLILHLMQLFHFLFLQLSMSVEDLQANLQTFVNAFYSNRSKARTGGVKGNTSVHVNKEILENKSS